MKVVILATCRNLELLPATLLVFDTIRVGFPTAEITVYNQNFGSNAESAIWSAASKVDAAHFVVGKIRHDEWVQQMVWNEREPFVICDTDMVFFEKVDWWTFKEPWAGAFQPQYREPWSGTISSPRLHTSLLFVRPDEVRDKILRYDANLKKAPTFPGMNFFRQQLMPTPDGVLFADTGANYYQACGGDHFATMHLDSYAHLHAGTWSDILGMGLREMHEAIYKDKELARGLWKKQAEFYKEHAA